VPILRLVVGAERGGAHLDDAADPAARGR
jgi:hypothetical protein